MDGRYHAVDWYWQAPAELYSNQYHWYVLVDVNEPSEWYGAKRIEVQGIRKMADTLPEWVLQRPGGRMSAL